MKGKGFAPAEEGGLEGMEKWHAAKPGCVEGRPRRRWPQKPAEAPRAIAKPSPPQYTEVFGRALVEEARRDPRVIGITAAMAGGTGLSLLARELPDQYYDVGIAEQHAVLFAAGLALEGMKPVAAIYSTFLQRAYDQIVHDVCLQRLNVVFCMDRAGLVGDDGPTHHGTYDISYLRADPEHRRDGAARRGDAGAHASHRAAHDDGPIALRYPRGAAVGVRAAGQRRSRDRDRSRRDAGRGRARRAPRLRHRRAAGARRGGAAARAAASTPTVCDARFAKPLDRELLLSLAAEHELLVTVEENVLAGGFGSAVLEHLADSGTLAGGPR